MPSSFRVVTLTLILFLLSFHCRAQYAWFKQVTGKEIVEISKCVTDADGNVFTIGSFVDDAVFMDSNYNGGGTFLTKLDKNGNLLWQKRFTYSSQNFFELNLVRTDHAGNVYISGQFPESMNLDGVNLTGTQFNSFIAKFNSVGVLQWVQPFITTQNIFDMAVNASGEIAVYGICHVTLNINNITLYHEGNAFVALMSTDGAALWARSFGPKPDSRWIWPIGIALDDAGSMYFAGTLPGTLQLDNKTAKGTGLHDLFFAKINRDNHCEWLKHATQKVNTFLSTQEIADLGALIVDNDGNLYASGTFRLAMQVDDLTIKSYDDPESFIDNFYVLKFDPVGKPLWLIGSFNAALQRNTIENIVIQNNKLYVSGILGEIPFFGILNPLGEPLSNTNFIPLDGDIGNGLSVDQENSIYMSGRINTIRNINPYKGYLFKFNGQIQPFSIEPGEAIDGSEFVCLGTDEVSLSTAHINHATSYQWEIVSQGDTVTLSTLNPQIEISLATLSITDNFKIRVRGKHLFGYGDYSDFKEIRIIKILEKLQIEVACEDIIVTQGTGSFKWMENNKPMDDIVNGKSSITPNNNGEYYIKETNECGTQKSNVVSFKHLFFPNIITPDNGDELNEYLVLSTQLNNPELTIVNRWGKMVFYNKNYNNNWNGDGLEDGVYFYFIVSDACISKPIRGPLTIKR